MHHASVALSPVETAAAVGTTLSGVAAVLALVIVRQDKAPDNAPKGLAAVRTLRLHHTTLAIFAGVLSVAALAFGFALVLHGFPANSPAMDSSPEQPTRLVGVCLGSLASVMGCGALAGTLGDRRDARANNDATREQNDSNWLKGSGLALFTGLFVTIGVALIA
jgi:hypothetical protein